MRPTGINTLIHIKVLTILPGLTGVLHSGIAPPAISLEMVLSFRGEGMVAAPFPASALAVAVVWEVGVVLCGGGGGGWRGLGWNGGQDDGGLGAVWGDAHGLRGGGGF